MAKRKVQTNVDLLNIRFFVSVNADGNEVMNVEVKTRLSKDDKIALLEEYIKRSRTQA